MSDQLVPVAVIPIFEIYETAADLFSQELARLLASSPNGPASLEELRRGFLLHHGRDYLLNLASQARQRRARGVSRYGPN